MSDTQTTTASSVTRDYKGQDLPVHGDYVLDPAHTTIEFVARHLMISKVRGRFTGFEGSIHVGDDPEDSKLVISVDASSIDTSEPNRDAHLRSGDFLETDKYPKLTFKSTKVEHVDGNEYRVTGDLTMHGVTKAITFQAEYNGQSTMMGAHRAGLTARAKINRKEFDLGFGSVAEAGQVAVSETVNLEIDLEAIQAATPAEATPAGT